MDAVAQSDEELMLAYQKGNGNAFRMLLARHKRPLFSFIVRSTQRREVAEELFQEVFIRVIEAASTYQPTAKFRTWVYTIARNICVDHARKAAYRVTDSMNNGDDGTATSATGSSFELRLALERALQVLPDEQREVFVMREVAELSFDEIALVLDCPVGTVKSRMRYALERLREALRDSSPPPQRLGGGE